MEDNKNRGGSLDFIRRLITARQSLIYVVTWEEGRLQKLLEKLAASMFSHPVKFFVWENTVGLTLEGRSIEETKNPLAAIDYAMTLKENAFFLLKDLHREMRNNPELVRKLRDAYDTLSASYTALFIVSPVLELPFELTKEMTVVDLELPTLEEMAALFDSMANSYAKSRGMKVALSANERDAFIQGVVGLTQDEARNALTKAMLGRQTLDLSALDIVLEEKRQLIRKSGILEFITKKPNIEDIGGLENLKTWLNARTKSLSPDAKKYGLEPPKGFLMTGISGCGKSLTVQAVSSFWNIPLIRLDMNRIYSGVMGSPEETLNTALRTVEAMAPCVLWIDEIEKGIGSYSGESRDMIVGRIFAMFLTWMQEKEKFVFVAATANEIDMLPPEILRKGRFDEIFFVDLPGISERAQIFSVHLKKRNQDPLNFNVMDFAKATEGYNGSEIEQCVISALFQAFEENRALSADDIMRGIGRMVPLSKTMIEDIKRIKRWAFNRAVLASKPEKPGATTSSTPPRRDQQKAPQEDIIKTSFS
ncbi:MAG: AAA family ATPase [Deltaproteobacteria bacterium]|nr:AAA family ATPase [Candidatus Zymogenaceae bacterium]